MVRAWQKPVESVLAGGLGTLPLAPITDVASMPLEEVVRRMDERIGQEPPPTPGMLWSATGLLMGLQYPEEMIDHLLRGVRDMKESSFYQKILREGRAEGIVLGELKEARKLLIRVGQQRFGLPDTVVVEAIEAISSVDRFEELADKLLDVSSWEELLSL